MRMLIRLSLLVLTLAIGPAGLGRAQTFASWRYRAKIRTTGYNRPETLTNFPLCVLLSTNTVTNLSFSAFSYPESGADLRFAASNGTDELKYEIEQWNTNGTCVVWVCAGRVEGTNDYVWAYWGNVGVSAPAYTTNGGAWATEYAGVWHCGANPTGAAPQVRDSTSNANHGTCNGTMTSGDLIEGQLDGALDFDGVDDYVNAGSGASLTPTAVTFSAWLKVVGNGSHADGDWALSKGRTSSSPYMSYGVSYVPSTDRFQAGLGLGSTFYTLSSTTTVAPVGPFVHVAGTYDRTTFRLYINGKQEASQSLTAAINYSLPDNTLHIGHWGSGTYTRQFQGPIDEVRVASTARSSNWIWAAWASQASNASFLAYGAMEEQVTNLAVRTLPVSGLGVDRATLRGFVRHTGYAGNPQVTFCWDTADQGTAATSDWAHVIDMGTNWGIGGVFSTNIAGLGYGGTYYYQCYVTNAAGEAWSDVPGEFATVTLPVITNPGAAQVYRNIATLRGEVLDTGHEAPAAWFVYWMDGSATTSTLAMGPQAGAFSAPVSVWPDRTYHYRVVASNDAGVVWSDPADLTTLSPHYVWKSGAHIEPFTNWATAATNIQAAVDVATNPFDVVVVTNGVYTGEVSTATVTISNGIALLSVEGPGVTVIQPTANLRRGIIITSTATNALVSGFRIQDAYWWDLYTGGGAIHMSAGTVSNCVIDNARSRGGVAGVYMAGGKLIDCTLTRNHSEEWQYGRGGAVGVASASAVVENCVITNNYTLCRYGGAGVYSTANGTVRNCLIAGNRGMRENAGSESYGGGVNMTLGLFEHCTIAGNYAGGGGGGVSMSGGTLRNCVVYENTVQATISPDYRNVYKTGGTIEYSCATPLQTGTGNVDGSPELTGIASNDYRLGTGSAAIDSGTDLGIVRDLADNPRPRDGDGAGGAGYDMGCYEAPDASSLPFSISFVATNTIGLNAMPVEFAASAVGSDTNILMFWWDFNEGGSPAMTTNGAGLWTVTNTFGVGYYTVSLTASNSSGEVASYTREGYVQVLPSVLYVATNGNHVAPFATQADAATNIQAAVDAAYAPPGAGILINVGPGLYAVGDAVSVLKGVAIRGTNGPLTTIVDPAAANKRSFNLQHADAVLDGFSLKGASMAHGGGYNGGGVLMTAGLVTNCWFLDNIIQDEGGGVYLSGGTVVDCVFSNNQANEWQYGYGGAVRMTGGLVDRCVMRHNSSLSRNGGGAVYMSGGTLRNCLITTNACTRSVAGSEGVGGGVRMTGGVMENCTVAHNYSYGSGGGVHQGGGAISNSIVYFNEVSAGFPASSRNIYSTAGTADFSCSDPAPGGTGNTNLDPDFAGVPTNYHLSAVSPCRDTGSNQAWMAAATDLAATNRIIADVVDMGCYEEPEITGGPLICNFSAPVVEGFTNLQVVFTVTASGGDTNLNWFSWDFDDDGTPDAEGTNLWVVTNTYGSGYYDVSLYVENESAESASVTKSTYILVAPATVFVAPTGTAEAPYMDWTTAARSIQDAINVAGSSDTAWTLVRVADGVYSSGVQTAISKPITIRSEYGPTQAIMKATGSERVLAISHSNAWVEGLTFQGAYQGLHSYNGGGVYMTAGTVTNCIIRDNLVGGAGGGIYLAGGTVSDCTFTSNRCTEWQYGYGGGLYIQGNALCVRSVFDGNWTDSHQGGGAMYVNGGSVRNCLLIHNRAIRTQAGAEGDGGGAAVAGGRVENCTIAHNWAVKDGGGVQMIGSAGVLTNCIVYYNTADTGAQNIDNPVRIVYSCSPDLTAGVSGNITDEPRFRNTNAANYVLLSASPCVNGGTNAAWMIGGRDLAGVLRIMNGVVDMGAYESPLPPTGAVFFMR